MGATSERRSGASAAARAKANAGVPAPAPAAERHTSIADTLPPTPLKTLLAAGGELFVLSADADLIATVERVAGAQLPVTNVTDWAKLEAAIVAGRCGIALLDADLLGRRVDARIGALAPYAHQLVLLVAADREAAQGLMGLLAESKIHRLLIKPSAAGITRLLIESAVNRHLRLRAAAPPPEPVVVEAAVAREPEPHPRARVVGAGPSGRVPTWVFVTAGAAMLAGVALIAGVSSLWRTPPAATEANDTREIAMAPAASIEVSDALDSLVVRADRALQEGRVSEPPGESALDYSLAVLAAQPTHEGARATLGAVVGALFAVAEAALLADDHAAAARALAHVRRADPANTRLAFLEAQLERARAPALATVAADVADADASQRARAQVAAELVASARTALRSTDPDAAAAIVAEARRLGAEPKELSELDAALAAARVRRRNAEWLTLAETRMRAGQLFTPDADSAQHYLEQLRAVAPNTTGLDEAWAQLRSATSAQAAAALTARDWSRVELLLEHLRAVPGGEGSAATIRAELERGRLQEQFLATAAPANELTLLERVAASYPDDAERRGVEGWVEVEFVVDATGRPTDLTVVSAEPEGRFDEAALAAVRQYRYQPFERDGHVFERLVRLRIRFALR